MWRRLYLLLLVARLYFAVQSSYIHPDEHFQGPEVIASEVFGWPAFKTWEFTSSAPIRSVFPLWLAYGFPLTILKWIWEGLGYGDVPPYVAFYTLRTLMFVLSFVLEDWAIHELLSSPRDRTMAIFLVASSYVTWTYQTHAFSNSIETLLILWCVVLIKRIREHSASTMASSCSALAFLGTLGVFNRITFPAFLVIPAAQLLPHLFKRSMRIPVMLLAGSLTVAVGITMDTEYYSGHRPRLTDLKGNAVFTPWNNFIYNINPANLAEHGLHPFWLHFTANLPQLIGPALPLVLFSSRNSSLFWNALLGIAALSCFRHQEARFLLPAVPLLLASVKVPARHTRVWIASWISFNIFAGLLFGVYHQGGIVPAQIWLEQQSKIGCVTWWKTYSPPRWLLDGANEYVTTTDLMGMPGEQMIDEVVSAAKSNFTSGRTLLVAPASATFLDPFTVPVGRNGCRKFEEIWRYRRHIGLDDLDFGDDGIWPTLNRVIGRRGLVVWKVNKQCL